MKLLRKPKFLHLAYQKPHDDLDEDQWKAIRGMLDSPEGGVLKKYLENMLFDEAMKAVNGKTNKYYEIENLISELF